MDSQPNGISIETERLLLRPFGVGDFAAYAEISADPETFRYSERGAMTGEEAWSRLLRHAGHWSLIGYGMFAVEEKASGRFVGEAGLGDFRRRLGQSFDPFPEAAWMTAGWARGRGYASEAAAAAHDWMEESFGVERTVCLIHAENHASLRVARKLGYAPFADCTYRGYPALLHERGKASRA